MVLIESKMTAVTDMGSENVLNADVRMSYNNKL